MKIDCKSLRKANKLTEEYFELREKKAVLNARELKAKCCVLIVTDYGNGSLIDPNRRLEFPLPLGCWQGMIKDVEKRMKEIEEELEKL